jgi:hypothetical protein
VGEQDNGSKPRFEGETVRLGEREYVLPSLSVSQARKLWPKIKGLNEGITEDTLPDKYADSVAVIQAALSRNYPEITVEQLLDLIGIGDIRRLLPIASGQSGLNPGTRPAATKPATTT